MEGSTSPILRQFGLARSDMISLTARLTSPTCIRLGLEKIETLLLVSHSNSRTLLLSTKRHFSGTTLSCSDTTRTPHASQTRPDWKEGLPRPGTHSD